jgi:hypothetical protein
MMKVTAVSTLATLALISACGTSSTSRSSGTGGSGAGTGAGASGSGAGGAAAADPLYSIASLVEGPNGRTLYLQTVTSLDKDLTNAAAIEVPGNSRHWAHEGSVYIGLAEEPTIVKYTPNAAGQLVEAKRVSFENYGLSSIPAGLAFISGTKAYLMAEKQYTAIIWDPAAMELRGTIDLTSLKRDGYNAELSMVTVSDNTVYAPLRYVNFQAADILHDVSVLILDAAQDKIVNVAHDDRCPSAEQPAVLPDGSVYVLADGRSFMAQNYAIAAQKPVPKNCILRILPGQTSFDPKYYVAVPTLGGGKDVATPLWYVSDKVGYAKLFYPDAVKPGADTSGFNLWVNPVFKLWKFELGDEAAAQEVKGAPFSMVAFGGARVDGKLYIGEAQDSASCTVYELDPKTTEATAKFKMAGLMRDLYRLR